MTSLEKLRRLSEVLHSGTIGVLWGKGDVENDVTAGWTVSCLIGILGGGEAFVHGDKETFDDAVEEMWNDARTLRSDLDSCESLPPIELTALPGENGLYIARALHDAGLSHSRSEALRAVAQGHVRVNSILVMNQECHLGLGQFRLRVGTRQAEVTIKERE